MSKVNAYLNTLYYQEFQHQYVGHFFKNNFLSGDKYLGKSTAKKIQSKYTNER